MKVTCPTCARSDLDTVWAFYVPGHASGVDGKPCDGGEKGSKPNYSKDRKKQLCFRCGKYISVKNFRCPHCDK